MVDHNRDYGLSKRGVRRVRNGKYEHGDAALIEKGIELLREARELFRAAGAVYTTERVRLALSSAMGARRNAGYRKFKMKMRETEEKWR